MEATRQIAELLHQTLTPDGAHEATDALERLFTLPNFTFSLLSIAAGGENHGQKIAAATYLKNFVRRNIEANDTSSKLSIEFKDALMRVLLEAEPPVLKVLVEVFRLIVEVEFVKNNSWPELVPELRSAIESSDLICENGSSKWKTSNTLVILQSLFRPFQYFLNPKLAKEPVPAQLELITAEILVPVLSIFHRCVEKALGAQGTADVENEKILLTVCKCIYFAVRSQMPSALTPVLPSLCQDLFGILNSLCFDDGATSMGTDSLQLKAAKRSLLIFCAFVTRHRKFTDKLMPDIVSCALEIVKHSRIVSKLDSLSERIISLAFDVISRVLETGPGWRLVSPHFSSLINSAIFPALVMNEKDIEEWEEDADEYIRKNLPCDLEEISGWREDLFTARKSALNLLGVISVSKGPPQSTSSITSKRKKGEKNKRKYRSSMGELLVLPFLSKFPVPTDASTKTINEYYGVLMAFSSLVDFLNEQKLGFRATLIKTRVLPLYQQSSCQPYLVAPANWVLGELVSCLPEDMSSDIYISLMKALAMPDMGDVSCYPVRMSAAGAIAQLVENDYLPPDWLTLLQVIVGRISDEGEETPTYLELIGTLVEAGNEQVAPHIPHIIFLLVHAISKCIPPQPEPWPQMTLRGCATIAAMAQCWEDSFSQESEQDKLSEMSVSGQSIIKRSFSDLLQHAWLTPLQPMEGDGALITPPSSGLDDSSELLRFIMHGISESNEIVTLKVSELLLVWSNLIADWDAWDEMEDLSIFNCIKEAINLHRKFTVSNFIVNEMPSPPAPPVPRRSIIEGMGAFINEAFSQYPSAVWRASSCMHVLLHDLSNPFGDVKQALVAAFSRAALSRFKETQSKPCPLWKPLLLAISSCYLCCPAIVEKIVEKTEQEGLIVLASALAFVLSSKFEHSLSTESEIKLAALALAKVTEQLPRLGNQGIALLQNCISSLMEASVRMKELQEQADDGGDGEESEERDSGNEDTEEDDDDEDSEDDEHEETEEEFLERCAETAIALENGTAVEEGDIEDQDLDIELGALKDVDVQSLMLSLIKQHHGLLIQGEPVSPQLISSFLEAFPAYNEHFALLHQ